MQDRKEDWLKEAPQMGNVYRNAVCNIAATGFVDGSAGLFVTRDPVLLEPFKIFVNWDRPIPKTEIERRGHYYLLEAWLWDSHVSEAPLSRRA